MLGVVGSVNNVAVVVLCCGCCCCCFVVVVVVVVLLCCFVVAVLLFAVFVVVVFVVVVIKFCASSNIYTLNFSLDSTIFENLCSHLWKDSPAVLLTLLKKAENIIDTFTDVTEYVSVVRFFNVGHHLLN